MKCPICGRKLEEKFEVSVYWSLNGLSESERKTLKGHGHDVGFACPSSEHDDVGWDFLLLDGIWFVFTRNGWRRLVRQKVKVIFS